MTYPWAMEVAEALGIKGGSPFAVLHFAFLCAGEGAEVQ